MMRYLLLLAVATAAHGQYGAATSIVSGNGAPVAAQCTNANNVGRVWARKDGGAASTTFYICAATGAGTYGWQLNDGAIGGAGNIASGQVLYGTAAGVAGSEAAFAYNATNNWLGIGAAPTTALDVTKTETVIGGGVNISGTFPAILFNGNFVIYQPSGSTIRFRTGSAMGTNNGSDILSMFSSGNVAIGTTTDDGTNLLQVAGNIIVNAGNSLRLQNAAANQFATMSLNADSAVTLNYPMNIGSSSALTSGFTLGIHNGTPTTGVTQLIVRAGAGQSTTNLLTVQNSGGTALAGITQVGSFFTGNNANATGDSLIDANGLRFGSTVLVRWSNNLPVNAADFSLSRAGINIGQFGDGGSNSNGLIYLKGVRPVGSTVANLPTAAGNTGMMATATDATVTTIGTTVAGGGANTVLVWSNGTNWRIYAN